MARGQYLEIKGTGISPAVIARVYSALWGISGCVSCRIRSEVVGQKKGDVAGRVWEISGPRMSEATSRADKIGLRNLPNQQPPLICIFRGPAQRLFHRHPTAWEEELQYCKQPSPHTPFKYPKYPGPRTLCATNPHLTASSSSSSSSASHCSRSRTRTLETIDRSLVGPLLNTFSFHPPAPPRLRLDRRRQQQSPSVHFSTHGEQSDPTKRDFCLCH